jgi:hypothetical protein
MGSHGDTCTEEKGFGISNMSGRGLRWDNNVREVLVETGSEVAKQFLFDDWSQLGSKEGLDISIGRGTIVGSRSSPL